MEYELTDTHCHILPGLDDGSLNMEETLQVLREAERQNVGRMIVTPHFYPGKYEPGGGVVAAGTRKLQEICRREGISIELYAGQECYYCSELAGWLEEGKVLTLAGSRYVLVEFDPDCPYSQLRQGVGWLQQAGYVPVLAHFERYACLRDGERLGEIKSHGCLLQMNFDTLLLKDRWFHRNPWRELLKTGAVDLLGSDCHGTHFRPLRIERTMEWLESQVDPGLLRQILETNVNKILRDE